MNLEALALWSQVAGAIIFVICVLLIWNKWIAPAVQSYQESKNAELAEAESRRERMRAAVSEARAEVERAEADARMIRERIAAAAEADRAKFLAEAKADAERLVHNAEGELVRARMAARDRLRIEFIERALAKARTLAATRVDEAVDEKLIRELIDGVAGGKA
jgi:F0F1-type ATP synthase membrane subunit b/b'